MDLLIEPPVKLPEDPVVLKPLAPKNQPLSRLSTPDRLRTQNIKMERFALDVPPSISIGVDTPKALAAYRYMYDQGVVRLGDLVKEVAPLSWNDTFRPQHSTALGLLCAFRHLMCVTDTPRVCATYVAQTASVARFYYLADSVPGHTDAIFVPVRWARKVVNLIERDFVRVWIDTASPPTLCIQTAKGKFKFMSRLEHQPWGWNIIESSSQMFTSARVAALI
jgi:hypothetical protein